MKCMKNLSKKIILSFFSFFFLISSFLTLFASSVKAQSTWYNQSPFEFYVKVFDEEASPPSEIFGERYTAAQIQWVIYSLLSFGFNLPYTFIGMTPSPNICAANILSGTPDVSICWGVAGDFLTAIKTKFEEFEIQASAKTSGNGISMWGEIFNSNRPISAIGYVKNIVNKVNPVSKVEAAEEGGFGFTRLEIVADFWKIFRNIAYFLIIVATIAIAFMIMFKVKISPQAVISIQSAIPKIIVTLILITFSFAIAGLLIDLMYILMGLFSVFFANFEATPGIKEPSFVFNIINGFFFGGGVWNLGIYFFVYLGLYLFASLVITVVAIFDMSATSTILAIILLIFSIILSIILIVNMFKVVFALFKALAGFYFSVIIGPMQILSGVLPNAQHAFSGWLKSMASKLIVFPATGILYYFSTILMVKSINVALVGLGDSTAIELTELFIEFIASIFGSDFKFSDANLWGPPMLGNGATATSIAFLLMSIACIMLIPKISKMIEAALAGRPFDMESALKEPADYSRTALTGARGLGVGVVARGESIREDTARIGGGNYRPSSLYQVLRTIGWMK